MNGWFLLQGAGTAIIALALWNLAYNLFQGLLRMEFYGESFEKARRAAERSGDCTAIWNAQHLPFGKCWYATFATPNGRIEFWGWTINSERALIKARRAVQTYKDSMREAEQ